MSFDTLGLSAELLRAVTEHGYSTPTPIQSQAIPVILQGKDLMGGAQTGTGKTAGFTLPMLQLLSKYAKDKAPRRVRALILTPTRELAAQVSESVKTYGKYLPLKSAVIFGGVSMNQQTAMLRHGVDIVVATPGRLLDHANQKHINLSQVEILILDEADRMLDMGFMPDVRRIINLLPQKRQNLLFSATYSDEMKKLAESLLHAPVIIEAARRNASAELIEQLIHPVDRDQKSKLLSHLIRSQQWRQVLVFTRTKHGANRLAEKLSQEGIRADAIHGNKSQGARSRALKNFKDGHINVLVATDIAARGLDINQLPYVVNFELPYVAEDYVHRIGRTGRAGRDGKAVSLVCVDEYKLLRDIENLLNRDIPKEVIPGYEPDPSIRPVPLQRGRSARPQRKGAAAHTPASGKPSSEKPRHGKHMPSRKKSWRSR